MSPPGIVDEFRRLAVGFLVAQHGMSESEALVAIRLRLDDPPYFDDVSPDEFAEMVAGARPPN